MHPAIIRTTRASAATTVAPGGGNVSGASTSNMERQVPQAFLARALPSIGWDLHNMNKVNIIDNIFLMVLGKY